MKTTRITFFAVLLIGASSLVGCRGMKSSQPPIHPNPNMDNVTRIEAQEPSDFWSDGRGMRPDVPGTVAVGELRNDTHLYEGKVNGLWTSQMPAQVPLTGETLLRGQERFNIYCTPCHGEAGLANGGIVGRRQVGNSWTWPITEMHTERARGYRIGELYDVVTNGYNTMPGYAAQIHVQDRWAIAGYVRALQVAHAMPLAAVPANVRREQGWN